MGDLFVLPSEGANERRSGACSHATSRRERVEIAGSERSEAGNPGWLFGMTLLIGRITN
jgi:hypothetical protein